MTKWILIALMVWTSSTLMAQNVGINETGAAPDPSAMLDIVSANKGFLAPRLPDHTIIAAPATGLLVYNTTTSTFWFFNGTIWIEITFPVSEIRDADGDTWVSAEFTPDEDIIRFGAASATSQMHFDGKTLHFTTDNVFVGNQSGSLATNIGNAFFGNYAGAAVTTGSQNTIMGHEAGTALSVGHQNVMMGYRAGYSLTTGGQNSIIGVEAGEDMTTSSFNTMLGYRSGANITSAYNTTLVGYRSGVAITTGFQNTMVGADAGRRVSTGTNNTYLGYEAGAANRTGIRNVAVGWLAGADATVATGGGQESVMVGGMAGRYNYANANTMVGYAAGQYNRTAFGNTFVGHSSGRGYEPNSGEEPGKWNAFLGADTGTDCDGCHDNVLVGQAAGSSIRTGIRNVFVGRAAGYYMKSGVHNVFLGYLAGFYHNEDLHGILSNRLLIANGGLASDVLIYGEFDNKRVGINTILPTETLSVNGNANKTGGATWLAFSDRRVKKNVAAFNDGLDVVMRLDPVTFQYKQNSGYSDTEKQFVGFIAQDVEKVAPYMVTTFDDSEGPSKLADKRVFDESALSKILVNAVQEQQLQIEALNARIKQLEALILEGHQPQNASAEK